MYLILFLIANIFKIAVFSTCVVTFNYERIFIYKLIYSFLPFIFCYLLLVKNKKVFIIFYISQFFYLLLELGYFIYFNRYLNIIRELALFNEGVKAFSSVGIILFNPKFLLLLIDVPFFLLLLFKFKLNIQLKKYIILGTCTV